MKITVRPTKYVIIRAKTERAGDQLIFALLHLSTEWELIMSQRLTALIPFRSDPSLYAHTYWDGPLNYYTCPQQSDIGRILIYLKMDRETWSFVEMDDPEEPERLELAESDMATHMMMIHIDGAASYMCFGKDSGAEYGTEGFSLREILQQRFVI